MMKRGDLLTDIMRALSFLSRIPVHEIFFENADGNMAKMARAFPVAGSLIALTPALLIFLLSYIGADPLLSATIAIGLAIVLTGALHEDGFADTADGFGGGQSRERVLNIMKDSRIGTYGALAIVFSFLMRVAAVSALIRELPPLAAAACLLAAACLSRGLMVWHWQALPSARASGVAASVGQPVETERNFALISAVIIALPLTIFSFHVLPLIIALLLPFAAVHTFNRLCVHKIGGHTGDTIGASQQITEIVMLAALALIA